MVVYSDIYLVVEDGKSGFELATRELAKQYRVKIDRTDHAEICTKYMVYDLYSKEGKNSFSRHPVLRLTSAASTNGVRIKEFYEIFVTLCKATNPLFGMAGPDPLESVVSCQSGEHYRNPYFFCVEPHMDSPYVSVTAEFIHDPSLLAKIGEIKKVLTMDELVNRLRHYCAVVEKTADGGITVVKSFDEDDAKSNELRYQMAKEVRKRGIELEIGPAEKDAIELREIISKRKKREKMKK